MIALLWKVHFAAIIGVAVFIFGYLAYDKIMDRLHPERAQAAAELRRLNGELQDLNRQLEQQKKILADSLTTEQVRKMTASGSMSDKQAAEYLAAREGTEAFASRALPALIRDKQAEIARLKRGVK